MFHWLDYQSNAIEFTGPVQKKTKQTAMVAGCFSQFVAWYLQLP